MRPNIFEISTKELTQDAFIAWLMTWADTNNRKFDENLHKCGVDFIKYLIKKQFKEDCEINEVEVKRQWEGIDIRADINGKYFIIIEDKIFSGEHGNQLERYKTIALDYCKEHNRKLICIYLTTGTKAKSSLEIIKEKEFSIIQRLDLINFFEKYDIQNNIYLDFVEKINNLEKAENAYATQTIGSWDWDCWTGFYHFLDTNKEFDIDGWGYVSNPTGGFLGLWWQPPELKDSNLYLQIEQGPLCFKIGGIDENRQEIRNEWFDILMRNANLKNKNEISKPGRFGHGKCMTVAVVDSKDWLGNDNEIINKENVIKKLKEYKQFLIDCLTQN